VKYVDWFNPRRFHGNSTMFRRVEFEAAHWAAQYDRPAVPIKAEAM
jgi:hypothetical protein